MKRVMRRLWICLPLLLSVTLVASAALAGDREQAQKLGREGKGLIKQGKFDEAASKFKEADDLSPAPSYKLELARMLLEMKDFLGAGETLRACMDAKPREWMEKKAQKGCAPLLEEVNQRTPKLSISVFEPEAGKVTLTVDGHEFDPSNGAVDYNPGEYEVVAKAAGYETYKKKVKLEDSNTEELEITMNKGAAASGADEPAQESSGEGISAIWAYSTWGVGVAALAVGIGFGVAAIKTTNSVLDYYNCQDLECTPDPKDRRDFEADLKAAKTNGNISTAGFVIGGVGIAAGTVLFFFSDAWLGDDGDEGSPDAAEGAFNIEARPLLGPGYVGVSGTF
jgi:tetratricopeptide (TPR) repeat protein